MFPGVGEGGQCRVAGTGQGRAGGQGRNRVEGSQTQPRLEIKVNLLLLQTAQCIYILGALPSLAPLPSPIPFPAVPSRPEAPSRNLRLMNI